jgi:tRNA-dihydrouridine synthase B
LLAEIAQKLSARSDQKLFFCKDFASLVAAHYEDMLSFYGKALGLRVARKHLGWYMDTAQTASDIRQLILRSESPATVLRLLPDAFHRRQAA